MLSTRFMPQILCFLQRETTFSGKIPAKIVYHANSYFHLQFFGFCFRFNESGENLFRLKRLLNSPFHANVGSQTMCFPYHLNDPNLIPFSMTAKKVLKFLFRCAAIENEFLSRAFEFFLPMARVEPARCQMAPAYPMRRVDCDVSHSMNYPVKRRCSEMIVGLITKSLNSQMLTSCLMMISSFAEESS